MLARFEALPRPCKRLAFRQWMPMHCSRGALCVRILLNGKTRLCSKDPDDTDTSSFHTEQEIYNGLARLSISMIVVISPLSETRSATH